MNKPHITFDRHTRTWSCVSRGAFRLVGVGNTACDAFNAWNDSSQKTHALLAQQALESFRYHHPFITALAETRLAKWMFPHG